MAPAAALWDSSSSSSSKTVCVMDAGGRLGSALLHRLLHTGYTVHAALHNPEELVQCYTSEKKQLRLRVFQADPLDYHSIMDALKGCSALFYSFELPSDHPTYDVIIHSFIIITFY
ncbi:UNVERIFIED_CONTAM: hypothetical protein Sangu_2199600 [Sesamum angustifolium]|uniref:NAD(P)-binding domain-containing protein n=1 Tax=Sesamum angustifolium TaxID=2727405 RepID=A0AAW2LFV9_9LAMI